MMMLAMMLARRPVREIEVWRFSKEAEEAEAPDSVLKRA